MIDKIDDTNDNSKLPDVIKNIKDKDQSSNIPIDMQYQFAPNNPYTVESSSSSDESTSSSLGQPKPLTGIKEKPGFFETAKAEAKQWNFTYQAGEAAINKIDQISLNDDPHPDGWTPKTDPSIFENVEPQYQKYLLEATGPKEQKRRLALVMEEQHQSELLANGSTFAKIIGGIAGIVTDPITYIPIAGMVKYAKFAPTIVGKAARALPGVAVTSVLQNAAKEADRINGNVEDFVTNSFIDTAFGAAIFGGLGGASLAVDHMKLWDLRKNAKSYIDGFDFKFRVADDGKLLGFEAINKEAMSAQIADDGIEAISKEAMSEQKFAQELADASFGKSGLFQIPYFNEAAIKFLGNDFWGTPLPKLLNSPYKTVAATANKLADHNILTEGILEGGTATDNFQTSMNMTTSRMRLFDVQISAMHLQRNGLNIKNRIVGSLANMGMSAKSAGLKVLGKSLEKEDFISKDKFYEEIQNVLFSETQSSNAIVNEAAAMFREKIDSTYSDYRKAYNLPDDWMSPKTAEGYLMRVYDTAYMNANEGKWISAISNWLEESDGFIAAKMQPINDLEKTIKDFEEQSISAAELPDMKRKLKAMQNDMQNKLRSDPDYNIHIDDHTALSATESEELTGILNKYIDEEDKLQGMAHNGEINPRYIKKIPGTQRYEFADPENKLKFRETYKDRIDRETRAKAYYDTILNQTAEHTIAQVMGKVTGNSAENHIKARTLLIPDEVLYENNFMSKNLMAKTHNYVAYLQRKTHLKTLFNDVTHDGGFDEIVGHAQNEYTEKRELLNSRKEELENKLKDGKLTATEEKDTNEKLDKVTKEFDTEKKNFDTAKNQLNIMYNKAMGINNMSQFQKQVRSGIMSVTSWSSLPFVPFTMINDLSANILQHGIWPFIRDGMYPIMQSFGGLLKTHDSESLRKTAPSIHLALSDTMTGYADRNWSMESNPHLNLGRVTETLGKVAHFSSNFTGTNYIDNGLQHIAGSITQAELMRCIVAYKTAQTSKEAMQAFNASKDSLYLRKYGIDPQEWGDRMYDAYMKDGGGKTAFGGHQSKFYHWEDLEASNKFGMSVYRGVKSTNISRGLLDSPFWADNFIGSMVHGFSGWGFASINRYVIPSMQQPDAQKLTGIMFMLASGYFISPLRRLARGEEALPDNQTDKERMWETIQDSGYFSFFANVVADVNVLLHPDLLRGLKNDKYGDRTRAGLLGPAFGKANDFFDILGAISSGQMNKTDLKKMARMIPIANSTWLAGYTKSLIEGSNWPKNRDQARAQNNI